MQGSRASLRTVVPERTKHMADLKPSAAGGRVAVAVGDDALGPARGHQNKPGKGFENGLG